MSAKKDSNRMNIVDHGDLDRITRSGHVRSRPGARASPKDGRGGSVSTSNTASTTSSRFQSSIASSLELLTPEEVLGQVGHFRRSIVNVLPTLYNRGSYERMLKYPDDNIGTAYRMVLPKSIAKLFAICFFKNVYPWPWAFQFMCNGFKTWPSHF